MTPWLETVEEIFHAALEYEPNQLNAFLNERCAGDEALRREVQRLLALHRQAGSFIETPIADVAATLLKEDGTDPLIGQTIDNYRISKLIGHGGMGAVYLAERADEHYKKCVAIKLIKRGMDTEPVLRHFRNERQILATLDHPNIARLFDGGATEGGLPHFIMECVDGLPIDQYCDQRALSIPERLKLFRDVCGAVSYAHRHDVVHRDIKPSNVLVTTEGTPKLLDFGIAKALQQRDGTEATATMTLLRPMTPEYASPEQVRGEGATPASDIYSLGVVLYQLLTGQKPYRLKTRTCEEISRAILEQEPTRPSTVVQERDPRSGNRDSADSRVTNYDSRALRGDLDNIVLMALRKEPERRYQSVEDLSEDIRRHLERRPVLARKDTIVYRGGKFVRRNPVPIGAASVCLLLLLAVVWLARDRIVISETSAPQKSIAVLPFQNLSSDPGNAYFADGIQEEILTRLSKIADLKIISRTSTQHFKNSPEPLPQIAQQLRVAHILEGTVQKSADQLRVNVQLINAQNDSHLWAEKYDRKLSDIFAVETEIATKIADTLRAKLTGPEQRAVAVRPTENTRAYELYLRGEHLWTQRTDTALLKAIDYFNQAVSLDPNYARAYAGIADCYLALPFFSKLNPAECRQKAKLAAHKALEIDGDLAAAHVSIAILEATELKLTEAKREFLRAIDLDPNSADAYQSYALKVLVPLGQFDEAVANFKRALELDPLSPPFNANFGMVYAFGRRYPDAIAQLRKTVELDPSFGYGHGVLGYILSASGQFGDAIPEIEKCYELTHDFHPLGLLGHAYALNGDRAKARQFLNELQDLELQSSDWNYVLAIVYLALGDKNEALHRLQESYRDGEVGFNLYIRVDPMLDPLRGNPAFERLANGIVSGFDQKAASFAPKP